jgi:hypothetical protein
MGSMLTKEDDKIIAYYNSLSKAGKKKYLEYFDIIVLEFNEDGYMTVEYSDKITEQVQDYAKEKGLTIEEAFSKMLEEGIYFYEEMENGKGRKKTRATKKAKG